MKVKPIAPDLLLRDVTELRRFTAALESWGILGILYDFERTLEDLGATELSEPRMSFLLDMGIRFKQGMCTNAGHVYDHHTIAQVFGNSVTQPNELHAIYKKPDESIFRAAASKLRLNYDQILMVGDKLLFDTSPAAALGMRTALVNPMPGHDVWAEYLAFRRTREHLAMRKLGIRRP